MLDEYIMIGEVLKPQGIRGEVKVRPITNDVSRFKGVKSVFLKKGDSYTEKAVKVTRVDEDAAYLIFDGVADRNAAELMRGQFLYVDRAHSVKLDKDTNLIVDLIGCEGIDTNGRSIGKMTDVMQPGKNDVYVFEGPLGEVLVPALKSVVVEADMENRRIVFDAKRLDEVVVFDED